MASDRAGDDALVDLTELEVVRRYSLAVRQGSAPRDEVLAALQADLDRLATPSGSARSRPSPHAGKAPAKRTARSSRG